MRIASAALLRLAILAAGLFGLTVGPSTRGMAEDAEDGKMLYETHCLPCHGPSGDAGSGGDIRGMTEKEVARATRGFEQMPAIDLSGAEVRAITDYLSRLGDG